MTVTADIYDGMIATVDNLPFFANKQTLLKRQTSNPKTVTN